MKLTVENLNVRERVWGTMAQFEKPLNDLALRYLKEDGFGDAECRAIGCMGWIWCQWLLARSGDEITRRVSPLVDRGMEMQQLSDHTHWRSRHDLYLLHCAIFACSEVQLRKLADSVVDASGHNGQTPKDDGELYTSAWSGVLKYAIKGDLDGAAKQYEIVLKAYRPTYCHATTKQLALPWLKGEWAQFRKHQKADFKNFWDRCKKVGIVKESGDGAIAIDIDEISSIGQAGCWSHCGLAILAYRKGIDVVTDDFWLPSHALLKSIPK